MRNNPINGIDPDGGWSDGGPSFWTQLKAFITGGDISNSGRFVFTSGNAINLSELGRFAMKNGPAIATGMIRSIEQQIAQQSRGTFFDDVSMAYNYMWSNSFKDGKVWRENSGWLVEGGVVVLPTSGYSAREGKFVTNGPRQSYNDYLPVEEINGQPHVSFNKVQYKIIGHIHTHPNPQRTLETDVARDWNMVEYLRKHSAVDLPTIILYPNNSYELYIFNGQKTIVTLGPWK